MHLSMESSRSHFSVPPLSFCRLPLSLSLFPSLSLRLSLSPSLSSAVAVRGVFLAVRGGVRAGPNCRQEIHRPVSARERVWGGRGKRGGREGGGGEEALCRNAGGSFSGNDARPATVYKVSADIRDF